MQMSGPLGRRPDLLPLPGQFANLIPPSLSHKHPTILQQQEEFACALAALALYDGDAEISAANISALLKATNVEVATYWPALWAGACKDGKIEDLMTNLSSGGGGGAAAAAGPVGEEAEAPKEEKPKEEEVDALDGGMDMFGGSAGGGDY